MTITHSELKPINDLTKEDLEQLILSFAASFVLADDLGDAGDDLVMLLNKIGINQNFSSLRELNSFLANNRVETLVGTKLSVEDDDEEDEDLY